MKRRCIASMILLAAITAVACEPYALSVNRVNYDANQENGKLRFTDAKIYRREALINERKAQGRSLSMRGVYNLIAHVCKALGAVHEIGVHGTLRPSIV